MTRSPFPLIQLMPVLRHPPIPLIPTSVEKMGWLELMLGLF